MRAPSFWWRPRPGLIALLLAPVGAVYGALTSRRMRRPGESVGVPVICVGNFIAGGAGKTPTALAIAARLTARGNEPAILSRGYGGSLQGPVAVDPARHGPAEIGDEPALMARRLPVIVARDRPEGARLAISRSASVIVMDDGLQNPSLRKTVSLAVVDAGAGIGNGLCLPAGPLRAPLAAQLPLVDAIVLIGTGEAGEEVARQAARAGKPVLRAQLVPDAAAPERLSGVRVLALSGIGRPEKFEATLGEIGARIVAVRRYPDHAAYRAQDVAEILAAARAEDLVLVTTEKDAVKLDPLWPEAERHRLVVVSVTLAFADLAALDAVLDPALAQARPARLSRS